MNALNFICTLIVKKANVGIVLLLNRVFSIYNKFFRKSNFCRTQRMILFLISLNIRGTQLIMIKKFTILLVFTILAANQLFAQPANTDCTGAFLIADPIEYCSGFGEFTNVNADIGNNTLTAATCWNNGDTDVWFRFVSFAKAINITVSGTANGIPIGGTMVQPQIALYEDDGCTTFSEIMCDSDTQNDGVANVFRGGLTIGSSYLIRVDSRSFAGTFQICLRNFNPPIEPEQDCNLGSILCNEESFIVQAVSGGGNDNQEFIGIPCEEDEQGMTSNLTEQQSTWFQWTCETAGSLTFILDPLISGDDIDWALYELPGGVGNCSGKVHLRCAFNSPDSGCGDLTGMNDTSVDIHEDFNCESNEDGFVESIFMTAGTSYALGINNFTNSGAGFEIEFGGTGTFQGPQASFMIDPLEGLRCDTFFTVTDLSTFANGNITEWEWNFGEGANPPTFNGQNPPTVTYESFGDKFIVLTVTTDLGCVVTEVLPLFAEPCCDDITDIGIQTLDVQDLSCADIQDGSIEVEGFDGTPEYEYALNDDPFFGNALFSGLDAGDYWIYVQDIKGCTDSINVVVDSPVPIIVDAGPDQTVDLGFSAQLSGTYTPMNPGDLITWCTVVPADTSSLSCLNCLDPSVIPPGETTYILKIEDINGCTSEDSLTLNVNLEYPLYAPNVFTPSGDNLNDEWTLFSGPAAEIIEELYIYDRWGELVFQRDNLVLNDLSLGWDGRFKSKVLSTQVFGWFAKVRYIDGTVKEFAGDLTLIKG